jgi:hypothetical protein
MKSSIFEAITAKSTQAHAFSPTTGKYSFQRQTNRKRQVQYGKREMRCSMGRQDMRCTVGTPRRERHAYQPVTTLRHLL